MLRKIQVLEVYVYMYAHEDGYLRRHLRGGRLFAFKGGREHSLWVKSVDRSAHTNQVWGLHLVFIQRLSS